MPFELPWLNNKPDPLLPKDKEIKPFLYNYDDYQTYDVLWFVPFSVGFYGGYFYEQFKYYLPLFSGGFFSTPIYDNLSGTYITSYGGSDLRNIGRAIYAVRASSSDNLIFFDRFTPWDYPWAEGYSTKLFHLLKKYCVPLPVQLNSLARIETRVSYNSIPENKPYKYLPKLDENHHCRLSFSVTLTEDQTFFITWLQGIEQIDPLYQLPFACETIKRYKILTLKKGVNTVKVNLERVFCACSMVVSGGKDPRILEEAINRENQGILYKNLDLFLADIQKYINWEGVYYRTNSDEAFYDRQDPQWQRLGDWFYFANLTYANNNYWKNSVGIDISKDLGKSIYYQAVYNDKGEVIDLLFNLWGHNSYLLLSRGNAFNSLPEDHPNRADDINSQTNIFQNYNRNEQFPRKSTYTVFSQGDDEALNPTITTAMAGAGLGISEKDAMTIIDVRKKAELIENA